MRSKRAKVLASAPGEILNLRGYPQDHPLRRIFPEGFADPRAFWGNARNSRDTKDKECMNNDNMQQQQKNQQQQQCAYEDLPDNLRPKEGEIVGSLGCGDWRIFQIADGNKLTVDDFVCAWVTAEEMRKRGYGADLHKENPTMVGGGKMFGGSHENPKQTTINCNLEKNHFRHADIGTGCGSVLMMTAWAFLGEIQSIGVEAQSISFNCLRRGLEWNLGSDGTSPDDVVQIRQNDLRTWDGFGVKNQEVAANNGKDDASPCPPYHLITGTPPYFPLDSFVASQNHEQKVRCRVPTRGGAPDYIEAASRFLMEENSDNESEGEETTTSDAKKSCHAKNRTEGVFCMVEAAFDKAEAGVLEAVKKFNMRVRRRVDVITRTGLPPRFSCWVMTKKSTNSNAGASAMEASNSEKANDDKTQNTDNNEENKGSDNGSDVFPIEILTLRNADFTRTKEYTDAMEIMGWVDFEKSKPKIEKTAEKIVGGEEG